VAFGVGLSWAQIIKVARKVITEKVENYLRKIIK
jgi:hypothetical protein